MGYSLFDNSTSESSQSSYTSSEEGEATTQSDDDSYNGAYSVI